MAALVCKANIQQVLMALRSLLLVHWLVLLLFMLSACFFVAALLLCALGMCQQDKS